MKKTLTFVWSLVLCFCLGLAFTVQADDNTGSITIIDPNPGNTYKVYQVLAGVADTQTAGDAVLSNITWGSSVEAGTFTSSTTAVAYAQTLSGMTDSQLEEAAQTLYTTALNLDDPVATLSQSSPTSGSLGQGYYLIAEYDSAGDLVSTGRFIMKVLGNESVYPKTGAPQPSKEVLGTDTDKWQGATSQEIGQQVQFKISAALPGNILAYTSGYDLTFNDTLSKGLTYVTGSATYEVLSESGTVLDSGSITASNVSQSTTDGTTTLQFVFDNVATAYKAENYSTIEVTYKATLNANAVLGTAGNPNTMHLTYSNNVDEADSTGTSATKTATVATTKVVVDKTDQNNKPLTGAQFTLSKLNSLGQWVDITGSVNTDGTEFTFTGLKSGRYVLKETVTPAGYNTCDPIYFTVDIAYTSSNTSGVPGVESITVTQTDSDGTALSSPTATFSTTDGVISTTVVNKSGITLPSTGGAGSVLLYVMAGLFIAGALWMFAKRRKA